MGIRLDIKRTDFYNELSEAEQKRFFGVKEKKFLPSIDNIYYALFLKHDHKENELLKPLLARLEEMKGFAREAHEPQPFGNGLSVDLISFDMYKYCLTNPDLYDIFILDYMPNNNTPRIVVQLRAYGLWIHGADKMIKDSYEHVLSVFEPLGCTVERLRENRIDYCYHTNAIQNPEKVFARRNMNKHLSTTMENWHGTGRIEKLRGGGVYFHDDYLAMGNRSSNNVFFRCYNKGLEVIEQGYKGFFFELWQLNGLISEYDRYCMEKAFIERNYDYIHKAKLEFYIEHGSDELTKKEYQLMLNDKNTALRDFKAIADGVMPEVTTVMNIEFETKRKFYYYSDAFIDGALNAAESRKNVPEPLMRIYKIIDNRRVFLDYLTETTVCFKKNGDFAAWWNRLRNTKLDGLKTDEKLVRDYSSRLDEKLAQKRFINSVATNAVYAGHVKTDFIEDIADVICNINDNDIQCLRVALYNPVTGKEYKMPITNMLDNYNYKKAVKYDRVKNRITAV